MQTFKEELIKFCLSLVCGGILILALIGGLNLLVGNRHYSENCLDEKCEWVSGAPR